MGSGVRMYILDTVEINAGTAATIRDHINRIVEEYQIHVTLVITDSASTMICAFSGIPLE